MCKSPAKANEKWIKSTHKENKRLISQWYKILHKQKQQYYICSTQTYIYH